MDELDQIMGELEDIMADLDAISIVHTNEDKLFQQVVVQSDSADNITVENVGDKSEIQSGSLDFSFETESDGEFDDTNVLEKHKSNFVGDALELEKDPKHDLGAISTLPFDIENIRFIDEFDEEYDQQSCDNEVVERAIENIDRSDLDKITSTQIISCQDINIDLSRARIEPQLVVPEALPGVTRIVLESRLILRQASAKLSLAIKIILVQAARQLRLSYSRIVMEQQAVAGESGWSEELAAMTGTRLMDVTDRTVRMAVEFIKNASRDVVETAVDSIKDSVASINDRGTSGQAPEIEFIRL